MDESAQSRHEGRVRVGHPRGSDPRDPARQDRAEVRRPPLVNGRTHQLRVYTIAEGALDQFIEEWRAQVVPLRRKFGFEVVAAGADSETNTFAWLVAFDGDFAARDAEYYASPEREAMDPDPARHVVQSDKRLLTPISVDG